MENKNKPKTTLKEVRKKKTKMKQKQKQKQQQSNKQTVKLNITTSGGGGGSGGSQQQKPSYMPSSFGNQEHTTLLKSINEQLKQKNEPVARAPQNFNIPQPNLQENERDAERIRNLDEDYADINNRQQDFENELQGLPLQFSEKFAPTPVITPNKIPIVNKPRESSGLSLFEQIKQKAEERNQRTNEDVKLMEEKIKENNPLKSTDSPLKQALKKKVEERIPRTEEQALQLDEEIKKNKGGRPKLTEEQKQENLRKSEQIKEEKRQQAKEKKERKLMEDEEIYQKRQGTKEKADEINRLKEQDKKQKKEETERNKLLESRRKANEKDNENQRISNHAFQELLKHSNDGDLKDLQEAYDRGFLTDKGIKDKLKKLKFTPAEIKRIFSKPK